MSDVKIDISAIMSKVEAADEKATFIMAQQALKDCNYYCKQDQDGLINSSLINSDFQKGRLVWKTIYVRMQYYLNATRRIKNKNARKMWAHYAAKKHKKDWKEVYQAMLKKEMHDD